MTGSGGHGSARYLDNIFSCEPSVFSLGLHGTDGSFSHASVPGVRGKACSIADGTRSRPVDVLVRGTRAYF